MEVFEVVLIDVDNIKHVTICNTKEDLANLMIHLDSDKYKIKSIDTIQQANLDYQEFCKKEPNLETGKEKNQ